MILDKVIIVACCLAAAALGEAENGKEGLRTSRDVLHHPYYNNNGHYYNNYPWNLQHPYRHYPVHASARIPANPNDLSPALYSNDVRHPDGSYHYEFETANGIRRLESSVQTPDDKIVQGSYSHVGPDGRTYTVHYIADKNGYRASGDHLPQQPQQTAAVASPPPPFHNRPIVVTTPRPISHNKIIVTPAKQPFIAATAFPPFNYHHQYHHPAAYINPYNVFASPYNPYSTTRPFLAHPGGAVVHPYPLGKK